MGQQLTPLYRNFPKKNSVEQWKKYRVLLLLIVILAVGIFLRTHNFSSWLHFELDQARDVRVVDAALLGDATDLPLLGPKAGGTFLRLGPGFYWLEYLGALLFGGSVVGGAAMVALFSILSIPLFYLVVKRYFTSLLALGLTGLFSVSAFMVMYGRFAWNPNFIPFFTLLGFYALLRTTDQDETRKGWWLVLAAFAIGMATHMHFLAFLALPTIAVLFLLVQRPKVSIKFWGLALALVAFLYVPMALNEYATGGLNTKEFFGALSEKSTKEDHPLVEKAARNVSEFGLHSIVVVSGFEGATFPAIIMKEGVFGTVCDSKCDRGKWYGVAGVLLFGLSVLSLAWLWFREREQQKKTLLLLLLLWLGVTFVLFLPLSYGIAPRFFLLNAPLLFILLGALLVSLSQLVSRIRGIGLAVSVGVISLLIVSNLSFLTARFDELSRAGQESVESAPDRILKERVRVTLEQQNAIVDFLEARSRKDNVAIYMFSEPQHRRALKYLMEKRGIDNDVLGFSGIYRQGAYFIILRAQSDLEDALKKYLPSYTVGPMTSFGTLVAIELVPKPEAIMGERQDFSIPEKNSPSQAPPRYTLREFLERSNEAVVEEEESEETE